MSRESIRMGRIPKYVKESTLKQIKREPMTEMTSVSSAQDGDQFLNESKNYLII